MAEYSTSNYLKATALKLGSAFLFAAMAVQVRYLGDKVPVGQVIFFRALCAIIPIVIVFAWRRELARSWHTQRFSAHVFRGALSIASSFCYYGALARLPVVDTTAISFVTPLMTVALAAIFLQEIVHIYSWSAVAVGFVGVIIMLVPYFDLSQHAELSNVLLTGLVLALLNAVFSAFAVIQVRRLTDTETTSAIVIYFSIFVGLGGLATLPFGWVMPDHLQLLALISAGFCGGIAHIMTTTSYRYAPASFLAPFDYSSMIWAFMLGYAFFGEIPAAFVAVGAVIVAAAGLFVVWRERQLGIKRLQEQQAVPARG
jgi:drug/metabolite transporter (DMT)-like permease